MESSSTMQPTKDEMPKELLCEKDHLASILKSKDEEIIEKTEELNGLSILLSNATAKLESTKKAHDELVMANQFLSNLNEKQNDAILAAEEQLAFYRVHYQAAINDRAQITALYNSIVNAFYWKITKPLRFFSDTVKRIIKRLPPLYLLYKGLRSMRVNGITVTSLRTKNYFTRKKKTKQNFNKNFTTKDLLSHQEAEFQRNTDFDRDIKFSILVPLYNTPEKYLEEMLESVINQTYQNWELCLGDGSDNTNRDVQKVCERYSKNEKRIKYKRLSSNEGISGNTNRCIDMATGDYLALLDHDDLLHPAALFEVANVVCEQNADVVYTDEDTFRINPSDAFQPHFKPDFAPDNLRANNYICHLLVFETSLLKKVGYFDSAYDGSQDHDMVLRLTEQAKCIVHIPKILYYWRATPQSAALDAEAKPYTHVAGRNAIAAHLQRIGLCGKVLDTNVMNIHRISYEIIGNPLVTILIPNKDHVEELEKCLKSIFKLSTYCNFEIIIIENNSTDKKTFSYYDDLECYKNVKIINYHNMGFNYSAINNFGAQNANGDYLLLLNNDIEVITPDWIQEMLMFAQRPDVGAVGSILYYPDNTIQHAGHILGVLGLAGHSHRHFPRSHNGYMGRLQYAQNMSGVTAACLLISKKVFSEIGGFDERFQVAFNDVDLCMRIRKSGYLIIFTPYAELYHYESKTRGYEDTAEKRERFIGEVNLFHEIWGAELAKGDPYYNPNLSLDSEDFSPA